MEQPPLTIAQMVERLRASTSDLTILPASQEAPRCRIPPPQTGCEGSGIWTGYLEAADGEKTLYVEAPCPWCRTEDFREWKRASRQKALDGLFGKSGIHAKWRSVALTDFYSFNRPLVATVERRLAQNLGFFVHGPVGVGKTHLMVAALNYKMGEGKSALYITVPDLLLQIRSTFDRAADPEATEAKLIQAAIDVDWLGLDDLGVGRMTDWARTEMFQIVNRRYDLDRPVIATSNFDPDFLEVDDVLGRPIVSRLHALCGKPLEMGGSDRRRS